MHSLCPLKLHDCASIYDNSTWYTFIILISSASQVGKGTNFEIVRTTFALGWPFVIEVEYYLLAGIYLWRISLMVAVHWSLIFACTYAVAADHNVAFHPVERDERHVDNLLQHHWQWKKKGWKNGSRQGSSWCAHLTMLEILRAYSLGHLDGSMVVAFWVLTRIPKIPSFPPPPLPKEREREKDEKEKPRKGKERERKKEGGGGERDVFRRYGASNQ